MAMGSMSPNFTGSGMRGTGMASSRQPGGAFRSPTPPANPSTGGPPNGMVYSRSHTPSQQPTGEPPPGMVYNRAGGGMGASSPGMTGAFDPTGRMGFTGAQTPTGGWNDYQPPPPSFGGGGGIPFEGNGASPNGMPRGFPTPSVGTSPQTPQYMGPPQYVGPQQAGRPNPAGDVLFGSGVPGAIGGDGLRGGMPAQQPWGQNKPGQGQPFPNIPAGAAASSMGGGMYPTPSSGSPNGMPWGAGGGIPFEGNNASPNGMPAGMMPFPGSNGSQPQMPQYMGPPQQSADSLAQAASFWNPAVRFPWQQIQQGQSSQMGSGGYPFNF